jgi:microcystin degradation protein MlrC
MPIRIATGGIAQETNTFQREPTSLADFQIGSSHIFRGEGIRELAGTGTIYGGILAEADTNDVDLVLTTYGNAVPGGPVSREAFETMRDEIVNGIRAALPVDGVLLGIHGAMALEHGPDGEGPLITAVREVVGPDIPIVAPLDLHTNLSDEMMEEATAFVGYKHYPHIDTAETGAQAMRILLATIRGEIKPAMAHKRVPLIAPNQSMVTTWQSPLKKAIDRAREIEQEPGVVAATVLGGFPFSDVPFTGLATIVVTNDDKALAQRYADELRGHEWGTG